jgi:hypothetical protein
MATTLKAHWIETLTQIADAGRDGIRAADVNTRAAAALDRRELVTSFEKRQYTGPNDKPGKSTWYRLTDAGLDWLTSHRENPTPPRALPAGWTKTAAGHYVHTASRIEVVREGAKWGVLCLLDYYSDDPIYSVITTTTRAAAFTAAATKIPAALELLRASTFEETGRPETWPAGQTDEHTVDARHLAVYASGTRTGYQAEPGDRVIHLELGTRGTYVTGEGDCSYVLFDGEPKDDLVHSNDVVVIIEPRPVATMQVTREPKDTDYTDLGGPDTPGEDYYLLVDGQRIGGTYWCSSDDIPAGKKWASWGAAGYTLYRPSREAAEAVQVREYVTNPSEFDRINADYERERIAEAERREAERREADAEWAEARRIKREGEDGPGETLWTLPAYHFLVAADLTDVTAVKAWLDAHDLDDVSGVHPIRVEQRRTRRVIVFERGRFGRIGKTTETWAVTCHTDPPAVDTTPRPDLVELITSHAHYPARFPLIDFGQDYACGPCTKELGSATGMVLWECPAFRAAREEGDAAIAAARAEKARRVAAAEVALAQAEQDMIAADATLAIAEAVDRAGAFERNRLRDAEINYVRHRQALSVAGRDPAKHAEVRFVMVSCSDDEGDTWEPIHWLGLVPGPGETASAQALRYAEHHRLTADDDSWLRDDPKPYRVEVFSDPLAAEPDGMWTNLADPCRPGRHTPAGFPITTGPARPGGPEIQGACCAGCLRRIWRSGPAGRWLREGDPLTGPSTHSDPHQDSDPDPGGYPDPSRHAGTVAGPSPSSTPVSFGFRIETRTGGHWRTVRVGNTPPIYHPDPAGVWAAADTVIGNARQVLGLGPKDWLPGVRVRAWDRWSGLTRLVSRRADRRGNQRA